MLERETYPSKRHSIARGSLQKNKHSSTKVSILKQNNEKSSRTGTKRVLSNGGCGLQREEEDLVDETLGST